MGRVVKDYEDSATENGPPENCRKAKKRIGNLALSAGPCLEGELVERAPHLTVHSFVRRLLAGELLWEGAEYPRLQIGEGDGGVHKIGRPQRVGFGRERQRGEVMATHFELWRFRDAFEIRDGDVQAGLRAWACGILPRSLASHPHPRAPQALL
jgi:hypothetical protein